MADASRPQNPGPGRAPAGFGARIGRALGRAVGKTLRSLSRPPTQSRELDRRTQQAEIRDDAGRKVILRRTTIDEVEVER